MDGGTPGTPATPVADEPLLRVRGLSKTFPGLRALDAVDLDVYPGEVVAVVGQNGSGKSTLVKVLAGLHDPDPGARIELRGPGGALAGGPAAHGELHFIHQDLGLVPMLSTVENLDLGRSHGLRTLAAVRGAQERRRAQELIARFGASFPVDVPVSELTASERTIVAIARALDGWSRPDNVLVLDEPTASLHGEEVGRLFEAVRRVAAAGAGVVFISHRLDEVIDLADRVVVLRDGRKVADVPVAGLDRAGLVRLIIGRDVAERQFARGGPAASSQPALEVSGLTGATVHGVDLTLYPGEVVGVTGILGSGREQLCSLLFGSTASWAGEVRVAGRPLRRGDPRAAIRTGMGFVPADRRVAGAVMTMNARENLTLPRLSSLRRRSGRLDGRAERAEARHWASEVGLRPAEPERRLELFSGGNQQKVVLAKWLRNEPPVLLLDEPTQGVDVGAQASIYQLIRLAADRGSAVLVTSSDTKELAALCDRVLVFREGRLVNELPREELSETRLVMESLGIENAAAEALFGQGSEDRDVHAG
ncbi:sugar ABC transporter ATP-binding protein [Blastococcus sp. SYSU D00820]